MQSDVQAASVFPLRLSATPDAPAAARSHVRAFCAAPHGTLSCDLALLMVSELVGNAVRYAPGDITLDVTLRDSRMRIEVTDTSPVFPRPQHARPTDEGGRGLMLVEALSADWGIDLTGSGKTVWAEVPLCS